MLIRCQIADLAASLTSATAKLGNRLHPLAAASLADLVRVMNCYYSNLIESHHTQPKDIERALADDLDQDETRRNLQIEARAHIRVQKMIDQQYAQGEPPMPTSVDYLRGLHQAFYQGIQESLLWIEADGRGFRMEPGLFRSEPAHYVAVGRHIPPPSERVEAFMRHFEWQYRLDRIGKKGLKPEAFYILERLLLAGDMQRGEASRVTGLKERSAREVLGSLLERGLIGSVTPKGQVSLRFPVDAADRLFPRLFA